VAPMLLFLSFHLRTLELFFPANFLSFVSFSNIYFVFLHDSVWASTLQQKAPCLFFIHHLFVSSAAKLFYSRLPDFAFQSSADLSLTTPFHIFFVMCSSVCSSVLTDHFMFLLSVRLSHVNVYGRMCLHYSWLELSVGAVFVCSAVCM